MDMVRLKTKFGMVAVAALAASAGALPVAHAGDEEALFGPRYHSVSITKDGQPRDLVKGTKLRVKFFHADDHDGVRWHSGCNYFGARIKVTNRRIETGDIAGTEIGCAPEEQRQDDFFARFFKRDPAWSAKGRHLTLSTERVVIELRRRAPAS